MRRRIFGIMLVLCMVAMLLPTAALAANEDPAAGDVPAATIVSADMVCRTQDLPFSVSAPEGATGVTAGYEFPISGGSLDEGEDGTFLVQAGYYSDSDDSILISAYITMDDGSVLYITKTVAIAAEHIDENDDHDCDICGTVLTAHTGGVASCSEKAICEICGKEYGEFDPDDHSDLSHTEEAAATADAEGNIEYWYCADCDRYFSDEACTKEITPADTVIAKLPKADDNTQPSGDDATPPPSAEDDIPKTGDISIACAMLLCGGALVSLGVIGRKRRYF